MGIRENKAQSDSKPKQISLLLCLLTLARPRINTLHVLCVSVRAYVWRDGRRQMACPLSSSLLLSTLGALTCSFPLSPCERHSPEKFLETSMVVKMAPCEGKRRRQRWKEEKSAHLMCHEVTLSQWNRYKKQPCSHSRGYFKALVLFLIYYGSHLFSLSVTSHVFARLLVLHYYRNWIAFCTREQNVPKYLPPSRTWGAKCCERCGCWV